MIGLIKKVYMRLLISIVNASNQTKSISLSNQKCMSQLDLINLHPRESSQDFNRLIIRNAFR